MTATQIHARHRFGGLVTAWMAKATAQAFVQFNYDRLTEAKAKPGVIHAGDPDQYSGEVLAVFQAGDGSWLVRIRCLNRLDVKTKQPQVRAFRIERIRLATVETATATGELRTVFKS